MFDFSGLLSSAGDWLGNANASLLGGPELTSINQFMPQDIYARSMSGLGNDALKDVMARMASPAGRAALGNLGMSLLNQAQPDQQQMSMGGMPSAGISRGSYTPLENFLKLWHSKGQTYGY